MQLIVFADSWGAHPSSAKHLVRHLAERCEVLWVNTQGRPPSANIDDLRRSARQLRRMARGSKRLPAPSATVRVITPPMWPGARSSMSLRMNRYSVAGAVRRALSAPAPRPRRVVLTTLPITADWMDAIDADAWVYYCVDDFALWPGIDFARTRDAENALLERADAVVVSSPVVQQRFARLGHRATLLAHGIDPEHWARPASNQLPTWPGHTTSPRLLYWGCVDRRLDSTILAALHAIGATILLIGPRHQPDRALAHLERVHLPGPSAYDDLPAWAASADALILPLADNEWTRTLQPLKLKEYMATGKPVIARRLPALAPWDDAVDLAATPEEFVRAVRRHDTCDLPLPQRDARRRLAGESWKSKAAALREILDRA